MKKYSISYNDVVSLEIPEESMVFSDISFFNFSLLIMVFAVIRNRVSFGPSIYSKTAIGAESLFRGGSFKTRIISE
ncbi:hypothetical protein MERGE_000626 [Pneumocystis wakefieldiae]|uniref:Uncharacterized protein n=1 Tax=Pneumocystis wakefieldiae TaxID=38082 RepID=A0A899FQP0_9ASCO|nr:hypothetical protein MERGE_000626 [Pneumocystis wakefieldiae]